MKINPIKKKFSILSKDQHPKWDKEDINQRIHISEWAVEIEAIVEGIEEFEFRNLKERFWITLGTYFCLESPIKVFESGDLWIKFDDSTAFHAQDLNPGDYTVYVEMMDDDLKLIVSIQKKKTKRPDIMIADDDDFPNFDISQKLKISK